MAILTRVITLLQTAGVWDEEVRYLVSSPSQACYRDRGRNVICNTLPAEWDERYLVDFSLNCYWVVFQPHWCGG